MNRFQIFLLSLFFLAPAFVGEIKAESTDTELPEWFYKVSPGKRIGVIGYSLRLTASGETNPVFVARIQALESLSSVIGKDEFNSIKRKFFDLILGKVSEVPTSKGVVHLGGSYEDDLNHYEYLYLERGSQEETDISYNPTCDFKNCSPGWLCNPVQNGVFGVPGISYRASTAGRQLEIARKNALDMIEFSLGVRVKGKERYLNVKSTISTINYSRINFDVTKKNENLTAIVYTKASCRKGESMFLWQVSEDIPPYPAAIDKSWLQSPRQRGIVGVVGSSEENIYGFYSQQLRRAYENGINELSKEISMNLEVVEAFKNSVIFGQERSQEINILHKNSFFPKILGIYLDETNTMFVWVGQQDKSVN